MPQEQVQQQLQALGEQLTALSPIVCRRAIAALREADEDAGGEDRTEDLPDYCDYLTVLLAKQTGADTSCITLYGYRSRLYSCLYDIELFLNIVEGKVPTNAKLAPTQPVE
ncbi:MAG: hypothetical protein Q7S48_00655 [bacterium]|nr:hypothetical protein [bacterium]